MALRPVIHILNPVLFSGNIASGPISTALLNMDSELSGKGKAAYGVQGYGALIIFSGGALLASGVGAGYKGIKRD